MVTPIQMDSLKKALSFDRPPLCSGAISPPPGGLHLWYGKKKSRFIDFASATSKDLDLLAAACDPAAFGRGNEDVHDETYRKALKMDASNFAVQLDLVASGLIRTIEDQLLQGEMEKMRIRAELYTLNVYKKDSFFKAHKDTPRGTDMLGSLVIIYPTPHKGGELVLRHKGHEWKFGAKTLASSRPSPSLAYVAFYSDIEHEVLKVTSGRRVTITYNLYLVDPALKLGASAVAPNLTCASSLQATLQRLLKSPEFLPGGGTLGFGLAHLYPVSSETELQEIVGYLKGEDAHVYRACQELRLNPSLQMIYDDGDNGRGHGIMVGRIMNCLSYDIHETRYETTLVTEEGGIPVNTTEGVTPDDSSWVEDRLSERGELIAWVSPFNQRNRLHDINMAYGNSYYANYIYCSPCIIVRIAAAGDRM